MKKIISAALALVMVAAFSGCKKNGASGEKKLKIGIIQLVEHPALDKN